MSLHEAVVQFLLIAIPILLLSLINHCRRREAV
jgi:hypothetical protein